MSKAHKHKKSHLRYATIALIIVFLFSSALFFIKLWERRQGVFPSSVTVNDGFKYNGIDYAEKEGIETFLVLGLDKTENSSSDSYNNDKQADFLLLLVIDDYERKYSAIQINRDTMTEINVLGVAGQKIDTVTKQIALSHTYGNGRDVSCRNAADAVSNLLCGVNIRHYISVTMDGVPIYNDLLGGVTVTVQDDFTGIDDTLVKGKEVKLMGKQALTYVRTRYGLEDSSNTTRMERQRQYIKALFEKTKQKIKNDSEFAASAAIKMSDYIISDRSVTQLEEIAKKVTDYEFSGIETIDGEAKVGEEFMEFHPDEASVKEIVSRLFYDPKE